MNYDLRTFRDKQARKVLKDKLGAAMNYDLRTFRGDMFGGLTAAVVALPLALAFGVASGLGAINGLYGAIAVGFFAAVFGGTKTVISGPTGPMAVAMAAIIAKHADNDIGHAFAIVMLAGAMQILLGLVGIGRLVAYTPHSVISGFMSGIGVIIMVLQTLPFLGLVGEKRAPLETIRLWPEAVDKIDWSALAVATVTLVVGFTWPRRVRTYLPAAVAALITGTLLSVLWLRDIPTIGDVPSGFPSLNMPDFSVGHLAGYIQPAIVIALLGAIDTLLTALIADSITRQRHNPNRELIGQGAGNMIAGLFGGVPGAGSTTGTVVNIRSGGSTRVAGALCAVILLGLVLGLGQYVESIPHAVLAGILMKVGWDIVDWRYLARIRYIPWEHLAVMFATLGLTVFTDLVVAVALGLIAAGMVSARQFERLELNQVISVPLLDKMFLVNNYALAKELNTTGESAKTGEPVLGGELEDDFDDFSARVGLVKLQGAFTVASSNKLINMLGTDIRDHEIVVIDFSETVYMDESAALVVEQMIDIAIEEGIHSIVMGVTDLPRCGIQALDVLRDVPADHFVDTLDEAKNLACSILGAERLSTNDELEDSKTM